MVGRSGYGRGGVSQTESTTERQPATLYQPHESCSCPIHTGVGPGRVPCGVPFANRVTVSPIERDVAASIYEQHHSYRPECPATNICHHGVYVDDALAGAVTWRQPLLNGPTLGVRPDGALTRDDSEAVSMFQTDGGSFAEAARICIGVRFQNLASCGFARSMELFQHEHADRLGIDWLLTFIRADHVGSMLKALYTKGWQWVGHTRGSSPPSNRETESIHRWRKQRWIRPLCEYTSRVQYSFDN